MYLFAYQTITRLAKRHSFRSLLAVAAVFWVGQLWAQALPADAPAPNRLEKIEVVPSNDNIVVRLSMKTSLAEPPTSFNTENPSRISMDFQNLENGLGKTAEKISQDGPLTTIQIIQAGPRMRMVFNLSQIVPVETRQDGNNLILTFRGIALASNVKAPQAAATVTAANTKPDEPFAVAISDDRHTIRNVSFRRGSTNEGRILVTLSDAKGGIDVRRENSKIIVNFLNTTIAADLQKKLNVLAYDTPVSSAEVFTLGADTRLVIDSRGLWEHSAYQADNRFVLEIKPIKEDPYKLVQGSGIGYQGERLSLSFQNIAVRDLLKVIADFTGFNILTSNAVSGNLTLRLKDVPWDQALDIILQTKGLDKRKDGNVIWIGSQAETLANDRLQLEAIQRNQTLEPLRTEVFQLNYQTGSDVVKLLRGTGSTASNTVTPQNASATAAPAPGQSLLSTRGDIISDERTNKLFVTDTQTNLEAIRKFLKEIDQAPKQVAIEARIVETSDSFRKNLGSRIGFSYPGLAPTPFTLGSKLSYAAGGNLEYISSNNTFGNTIFTPTVNDQLIGNLAAPGIDNRSPGQIALTLLNKAGTRSLNLELTALQADGKGYVVSNPRVVTANQVKATVKQGIQIPYQKADSGGATSTSFLEAVLSLDVTPQITPDGRVRLTLAITKNTQNIGLASTGGLALDAKAIATEVMVDNGGTLVIGGIFEEQQGTVVTKIPFLGDIPIIGNLFKVTEKNNTRSEMLILITPRIISEEAAS